MKTIQQPLYKVFLRLRCNPQSREKIFTLSKQKWSKLLKALLRSKKLVKLLYDQFIYFKYPKSTVTKSKSNYRNKLIAKQRFKLLFGGLADKHLTRSQALCYSSYFKNDFKLSSSISGLFENRLDNILYEAGFVPSLRSSRQLIFKNSLIINGVSVNQPSYKVKPSDHVEIQLHAQRTAAINLSSSSLRRIPKKHLHINYRTLKLRMGLQDLSSFSHYNYFLGLKSSLKL